MKIHRHIGHHLKHIFIPHEGNEYRPHFFREISIAIILTIVFIIVSISASSAYVLQNTDVGQGIVARVLIDLTNQNRAASNLAALAYNSTLEKASHMKAEDMSQNGYFAHNSPAGITPWYWFEKAGYDYEYAGENLAVNFTNSEDVSAGWMNSPTHRANILSPDYKEIGISMAGGVYQNNNTIFVVQMFGTPVEKVIEPVVVKDAPVLVAKTKTDIPKQEKQIEEVKEIKEKVVDEVVVPVPDASLLISNNESEVKGESTTSVAAPTHPYSSVTEKTIFNSSKYASIALTFIFIIVFVALCVMIFIEIEKQHPRHIIYGVSTLAVLTLSIYIVHNVFELQFILL